MSLLNKTKGSKDTVSDFINKNKHRRLYTTRDYISTFSYHTLAVVIRLFLQKKNRTKSFKT